MKGIILAGGAGTRLYPVTKVISKQLLPIYDKPMIYYPLSVLMLAEIKEILIISTPRDTPIYKELLNDGKRLGLKITYEIQEKPDGIAKAFLVGEKFIGKDKVCLILGDNVFYGQGLSGILKNAINFEEGATIFAYSVKDPKAFGVVEFNKKGKVISLEEKPNNPKSNYAVPGLYFYDNNVINIVKNLRPSKRGELEITDLNKEYLKLGLLRACNLGRGMAWLDTGTSEGLLEASNFIAAIQKRQGYYIACIEEIAYRMNFINKKDLLKISSELGNTEYSQYLKAIIREKDLNQKEL